jgi:hypothetical protein
LPEIIIESADRVKILVNLEAVDFIGFFPHRLDRIRGADRHREDELFGWRVRIARKAALAVAPVAMPSSMTIATRSLTLIRFLPPR